jgi:hypothetical protein
MSSCREVMYERFQPWVLATYGDSAKTKTITKADKLHIQLRNTYKFNHIFVTLGLHIYSRCSLSKRVQF